MTATIIARLHSVRDEQLTASEIRERNLAYDAKYGGKSQIRIAYDLKAGVYRVWTTCAHLYQPLTPGYQYTSWGIGGIGVEFTRPGNLEHGTRSTPAYDRILEDLEDLADREADEMTARNEEALDAYLASLE